MSERFRIGNVKRVVHGTNIGSPVKGAEGRPIIGKPKKNLEEENIPKLKVEETELPEFPGTKGKKKKKKKMLKGGVGAADGALGEGEGETPVELGPAAEGGSTVDHEEPWFALGFKQYTPGPNAVRGVGGFDRPEHW